MGWIAHGLSWAGWYHLDMNWTLGTFRCLSPPGHRPRQYWYRVLRITDHSAQRYHIASQVYSSMNGCKKVPKSLCFDAVLADVYRKVSQFYLRFKAYNTCNSMPGRRFFLNQDLTRNWMSPEQPLLWSITRCPRESSSLSGAPSLLQKSALLYKIICKTAKDYCGTARRFISSVVYCVLACLTPQTEDTPLDYSQRSRRQKARKTDDGDERVKGSKDASSSRD